MENTLNSTKKTGKYVGAGLLILLYVFLYILDNVLPATKDRKSVV